MSLHKSVRSSRLFVPLAAAVLAAIPRVTAAASITWANTAPDWSTGSDWLNGAAPTAALDAGFHWSGDIVYFPSTAPGSMVSPVLNQNVGAQQLNFNNTLGNWTLSGAIDPSTTLPYAVTVSSGITGGITVTSGAGTHTTTINTPIMQGSLFDDNATLYVTTSPNNTVVFNQAIGGFDQTVWPGFTGGLSLNDATANPFASFGTIVLAAANPVHSVSIDGGIVRVTNSDALGPAVSTFTSQVLLTYGAVLQLANNVNITNNIYEQIPILGAGIQNFSDNNTFSGNIGINSSSVFTAIAGIMTVAGNINFIQSSGGVTFTGAGDFNITGVIDNYGLGFNTPHSPASSSNFLTMSGSGILTLANSNNFGGTVTLSGGTTDINALADTTFSSPLGTGLDDPTINIGNSTLRYSGTGSASTNRTFALSANATLQNNSANPISFSGVTTLNTKVLTLSGSGAIVLGSITGPGFLTNSTGKDLTINGTVNLNAGKLNLPGSNNITINGPIIGAPTSTLEMFGTGTLFLFSTSSTWAGALSIDGGTVQTKAVNVLSPNASVVLGQNAGVLLDLQNNSQIAANVQSGGTANGAISLGSAILTLASGSATYLGTISGSGGITVAGADQDFRSSAAMSYFGPTHISSGILRVDTVGNTSDITIDAAGALVLKADFNPTPKIMPASSGMVVINTSNTTITSYGGSSVYIGSGNSTFNGPLLNNGAIFSPASLTPGAGNTYRLSALTGGTFLTLPGNPLAGSANLLIDTNINGQDPSNTGVIYLKGSNTYAGKTTINAGDVVLFSLGSTNSGPSSLGNPSSNANATIDLGGDLEYWGPSITTNRPLNITRNNVFFSAGGSGPSNTNAIVTMTGAITSNNFPLGVFGNAVVNSTINLGTARFTIYTGTWTLNGLHTSGGTDINGGTLIPLNDAALGSPGTALTIEDGFLKFAPSAAFDPSATRSVTVNSFQGGVDTNGQNVNFIHGIGGAGQLFKQGAGTLYLQGNSNYTGWTFITGGSLRFDSVTTLPPGLIDLQGGTIETHGTFSRPLDFADGSIAWEGTGGFAATGGDLNVTITGSGNPGNRLDWNITPEFLVNGNSFLFGSTTADSTVIFTNPMRINSTATTVTRTINVIKGVGTTPEAKLTGVLSESAANRTASLLKVGDGALVLAAVNTFKGSTTIRNGSLFIGTNDPTSTATGGSLGQNVAGLTLGDASTLVTDSMAFGVYGPGTGSTTISTARAITVANRGASATLGVFTADKPTFSGAVAISRDINLFATTNGIATFTNKITGTGNINKTGAGTVVLANVATTFVGNTTVSQGTLKLTAQILKTSPTITVNTAANLDVSALPSLQLGATQTLTGAGTVTGNVSFAGILSGSLTITGALSGPGFISPGNSPGISTFGSLDPSGGMDFGAEFTQIGSPTYADAAASGNDLIHLIAATPFASNLSHPANAIGIYFDIASLPLSSQNYRGLFFTDTAADFLPAVQNAAFTYYILDSLGSTTFNSNHYSLLPASYFVNFSTVAESANFGSGPVSGRVAQFTLAPVPEPASLSLLMLGGLGLLRRRRR